MDKNTFILFEFWSLKLESRLKHVFFLRQEVADSRILCLALVHLPAETESWIVSGTQSGTLLVISTEDGKRRHTLEKMSDSITCLYYSSFSKQRYNHEFNSRGG